MSFVVIERVTGVDLFDLAYELKNPDDALLRYIFTEALKALRYLHSKRIAHRNFSLESIVVTNDFKIKIVDLDFCTKLEGRAQDGFLRTKVGTNFYKAPEIEEGWPYQG